MAFFLTQTLGAKEGGKRGRVGESNQRESFFCRLRANKKSLKEEQRLEWDRLPEYLRTVICLVPSKLFHIHGPLEEFNRSQARLKKSTVVQLTLINQTKEEELYTWYPICCSCVQKEVGKGKLHQQIFKAKAGAVLVMICFIYLTLVCVVGNSFGPLSIMIPPSFVRFLMYFLFCFWSFYAYGRSKNGEDI